MLRLNVFLFFFSFSCHKPFLRLHVKLKVFQLECVSRPLLYMLFHLCHKCKQNWIQLHTPCGEAYLQYGLHIATSRTQKNKNDTWHCQTWPLPFKLSIFYNCRQLICWGQRSLLVRHSVSPCVWMIPTLKELGLTFHFIMIINVIMVNFKAGAVWKTLHVHAILKQEQQFQLMCCNKMKTKNFATKYCIVGSMNNVI